MEMTIALPTSIPLAHLFARVAWNESKEDAERRRKPKRATKRRVRAVPRTRNILQRLFGRGMVMGGAR